MIAVSLNGTDQSKRFFIGPLRNLLLRHAKAEIRSKRAGLTVPFYDQNLAAGFKQAVSLPKQLFRIFYLMEDIGKNHQIHATGYDAVAGIGLLQIRSNSFDVPKSLQPRLRRYVA